MKVPPHEFVRWYFFCIIPLGCPCWSSLKCIMHKKMSQEDRFQEVLNQLKKAGYRITEQRKLLLHIILNNEYSSCKEIYYAAKKQDDKVGIATVYRTVQLLEDMELIHKEMVVRI